MRCVACDNLLHEHELSRKGLFTGEYLDMCDKCLDTIDEQVTVDMEDLLPDEESESHDRDGLLTEMPEVR